MNISRLTPSSLQWTSALCLGAALLAQATYAQAPSLAQQPAEDVPDGVEILLPRGQIAAVFEPVFVTAEEADISDEAIVLGVSLGDQAHAYSLNLLNSHEIVNDEMAGTAFAAVW